MAADSGAARPPRDIRLLLADVDGTLVDSRKELTAAARAAAHALHDAGIRLAITSGRPPRGMAMVIKPLAMEGPIAGFNGGVLVNPDLSVIESHTLDRSVARRTVDLLLGHGLDVWVYTEDDWLIRDPQAPHVDSEARTVAFGPVVVQAFGDVQLARVVKIVGVSDDLARVADCEKGTRTALGETASAARSQPYYLDITHPKANKGEVVSTLSRLLDIVPERIATIGDMPNDILMFHRSGLSIAMGNASDEVKAQASAVTASNDDEGFAKAVRRFVLPAAAQR
jgi:Cof subfamily protein (haloacid dehalogenase superfamily)